MEFLKNIDGLTDEQKAEITAGVELTVNASTATTKAEIEALKTQISGLEDIKNKSKAEIAKREKELAEASGDYSKVLESKETEFNEKLSAKNSELEKLKRGNAESLAAVAASKIVNVFTDSSKTIAELAAKSLVKIDRTDEGDFNVIYTMPDGSVADSVETLIDGIKKSDDFSAHIKANVAKGAKPPKGKQEQSGFRDLTDKKQVRADIKERFNLNS